MQGFNMGRYIPPSTLDPSLSSSDTNSRTRKWQKPAQNTIRFELPVAIWCAACPEHSTSKLIAVGVRFNAEKKRVGNYFSTPVFSFRFKHIPCGTWIEIRNDPKKAREAKEGKAEMGEAWVVTEGAKKRDYGTGEVSGLDEEGTVLWQPKDPHGGLSEERFEAREQVLSDFERKKRMKVDSVDRVAELRVESDRFRRDPDAWNKKLRSQFREQKKTDEEAAKRSGELQGQVNKRVKMEDFGKMVRHNTRERMLEDVWTGHGGEKPAFGVNVKPIQAQQGQRRRLRNTDDDIDNEHSKDKIIKQPLVGYQEDEW